MKKSLKILNVSLILILGIACLVGCGKKTEKVDDTGNNVDINKKTATSHIEEIVAGAKILDADNTNASGETGVGVGFYATENEVAFNYGNRAYLVYSFNGDEISQVVYYYPYEDEASAELSYNGFKEGAKNGEEGYEGIKDVKLEGKYVIIELEEGSYEKMTKNEIIGTYNTLKQIYTQGDAE